MMLKKTSPTIYFSILLSLVTSVGFGQDIKGQLKDAPNQTIALKAFRGITLYTVDSTTTDNYGNFKLSYAKEHQGIGLLKFQNEENYLLILEPESIQLSAPNANDFSQLTFHEGKENKAYTTYASQQPIREQSNAAWEYLAKLYQENELLKSERKIRRSICSEIDRLQKEEDDFLAKLSNDSYIKWYIPVRKLISSVAQVAQYRPEAIPATREALRNIDYADERLYKSGLFKDAIENHVWFIENSSGALDKVFADLNESIDLLLAQLENDDTKYNEVTEYLFNLLEKRSLFSSAEYLALKVLNEESCSLNEGIAKQLESYRQMKKGNIASDISFGAYTYFPEHINVATLKEIESAYKVVVFAGSWCGHCREQLPRIAEKYTKWKEKNVEVVLVSLEENMKDFVNFSGSLPFVATTSLEKWDEKAAKDYFVYATPTYYLLNQELEIILKPKNIEHLNAYLEQLTK